MSFPSGCLYNFPFITDFQQFGHDVISCGFLYVPRAWVHRDLGSCASDSVVLVFIKFGNFLTNISSILFFIPLSQPESPITCVLVNFFDITSNVTDVLFIFSPILFCPWASFWMGFFSAISSNSLIVSFTLFYLLLITSHVFLI